jgi:Zn-dependent peptidase ImmA (M78 family)
LIIGSSGHGDDESGSIVARATGDFTVYLSRHTSSKRDRFTIAHELGHLLLHFQAIKKMSPNAIMRATRNVDKNDPDQERAEWEANWFAAAFLMPAEEFKAAYRDTPRVRTH